MIRGGRRRRNRAQRAQKPKIEERRPNRAQRAQKPKIEERRPNRAQRAQKPKLEARRSRGLEVEDQRIPDLKIEEKRTQGFKIDDQRTQGSTVKPAEIRRQNCPRPRPNVMTAPPEILPRRFEYPVQTMFEYPVQTMWSPHSPRLASRQGSVILQASPYKDLSVRLTRSEGSLPSISRRRRPHTPVRDNVRKIREV